MLNANFLSKMHTFSDAPSGYDCHKWGLFKIHLYLRNLRLDYRFREGRTGRNMILPNGSFITAIYYYAITTAIAILSYGMNRNFNSQKWVNNPFLNLKIIAITIA